MYTFGDFRTRKQKHPNSNSVSLDSYMLLGSEPAISAHMVEATQAPSFTFASYYITKRQVLRNMRRLRRQQIG